jgi:hypothetical protein
MGILHFILFQVALAAGVGGGVGGTPVMEPAEILRFLHEVPVCEDQRRRVCQRPGGWDRIGAASEVAAAISLTARSREEAERMSEYAVFESSLVKRAIGDGGKSRGVFQLQRVSDEVAFTPLLAAKAWLQLEDAVWCTGNAPDEELAALASGSCQKGRTLVRRREALRRQLDARLLARDAPLAVE